MFNPALLTIGTIIVTLGIGARPPISGADGHATRSAPQITAVTPAAPPAGNEGRLIRVDGLDFLPGLELGVTGPDGAMVRIAGDEIRGRTATSFQATVTFALPGSYSLIVTNKDGGVSPPFTVKTGGPAAPNAPVLLSIMPANPDRRAEPQMLKVEGQRFDAGLRVTVTDPMGADVTGIGVEKLDSTSFEMTLALSFSGDYALVVTNASGAVSNRLTITVR
jgi:hypothetical protein